jgi:hypothetical protein
MDNLFTIYVEGSADVKFIKDYFKHLFNKEIKTGDIGGIIETKGKDKLATFENKLLQTNQNGGINLIIFDADTQKNKGGFASRLQEIQDVIKGVEAKTKTELKYDVFLLPDHASNGALEELLEQIINPANQQIFDCWKDYESCLTQKKNRFRADGTYTIPAKKSKIYSYLEVLYGETNAEKNLVKDPNRNYLNPDHWDLENELLKPLRAFLTKYCSTV